MKLSDFKEQRENANKHTQRGRGLLQKSIQRDGYSGEAMVSAADGELFIGSNRFDVSAEVFGPDIEPIVVESDGTRPVIVKRTDIPNADDPRAKRLGLGSNRIAQISLDWDVEMLQTFDLPDLDAIGFNENEQVDFGIREQETKDAEPQIDRAEQLQEIWHVKTGDLWQIGEHRLICGDCTDPAVVARVMGGEKADFTFTDPPYNVGVKYTDATDDNQKKEDYINWCSKWTPSLPERHLLTVGIKRLLWWNDILGDPQWIIAWIKRNGQGQTGLGGTNKWDSILVYGVEHDHKIDIIEINNDYSEGIKSDGGHPTAKPVELWMHVVERFGGETVYEPFAGSGTTLVACENLHRRCRAVEISPAYVSVCLERMNTAFPELEIKRIDD